MARDCLAHFVSGTDVEVPIQGSDDETDRLQAIADI